MQQQFYQLAANRSNVYNFLCQFYNTVPQEEAIGKLFCEEFVENLKKLYSMAEGEIKEGARLLEHTHRRTLERTLEDLTEELAVEFTRLFRGLKPKYGPPPPYESVYIGEGRVMGETTQEVNNIYLEAGFALTKEYGGPPDYIGTELRFMSLASYREAECWKNGDRNEATRFLKIEDRFLKRHMLRWIPGFCDTMFEEAKTDFYRGVAKLTRGFLTLDTEQIEELLQVLEEEEQ